MLAKGSAEADAAATGAVGLCCGFLAGALNGSVTPLLNAGPVGAGVGAEIVDLGSVIGACAAAYGG